MQGVSRAGPHVFGGRAVELWWLRRRGAANGRGKGSPFVGGGRKLGVDERSKETLRVVAGARQLFDDESFGAVAAVEAPVGGDTGNANVLRASVSRVEDAGANQSGVVVLVGNIGQPSAVGIHPAVFCHGERRKQKSSAGGGEGTAAGPSRQTKWGGTGGVKLGREESTRRSLYDSSKSVGSGTTGFTLR